MSAYSLSCPRSHFLFIVVKDYTDTNLPSAKKFFIAAMLYFEMKTMQDSYFSILSFIIMWFTYTIE